MKILCALLLCASATFCSAQTPPPVLLPAAGLQADAAILRHAYEAMHPGLYRYNTKVQMDAAFAELNHQLDHDQSQQQAFLAFSEFAARVKCGHTQANPFNQSKELRRALFEGQTRVPFYFDWLNRRVIVTEDFTPEHALPPGTEVLSINGVPAQTILAKLMTIARADGANNAKRIAQLAVTGDSEYETFDLYYPMYFPVRDATFHFSALRPHTHQPADITAAALTFEQRIAPIKQREEARRHGSDALFQAKTLPGGTILITMPTWALYNSKWDWKSWLNQQLNSIAAANAPALILDIRGNEGGDDVGNEIIPHLVAQPVTLSSMRRLVRYRKAPDDLLPYLDTWDKSFRDWGTAATELPTPWPTAPTEVPYLKLTRYDDNPDGDVIKPADQRFRGKVFVLIDATNSSATFQFAQNMQQHHLGMLIGQPTGGSQRGINGGAFFFVNLPHSGIELDLPLIGTFPPQPMPDAGITPDVAVARTAADIADHRDPVLATAITLAGKP